MEQAWPQNSDREQFYYLERESRKLVEIAMSDETLRAVVQAVPGVSLQQLRGGAAQLSQPGNGGWHFYGVDADPQRAHMIASVWATAFRDEVRSRVISGGTGSPEQFITVDLTQATPLNPERAVARGTYMLVSAVAGLTLIALALLLIHPRP